MKETKKLTVSVGIPAYNEEANIWHLLDSLLCQKLRQNIKLQEIIVISDGSMDKTVELVRSIKDRRIKIFEHSKRSGLYKTQNEIVNLARSDILVILDADVLPHSNRFLEAIIDPIVKDHQVGLVGAETTSAHPRGFIEQIFADSHELKKDIYKKINRGQNLYLCHGRARAFSRNFFSQIRWPKDCPEDAFSYLLCIQKGFKFIFTPKAKVIFRSPSVVSEHAEKSNRFISGKKQIAIHFPPQLLKSQYHIPFPLVLKSIGKFLFKTPITTIGYLLILLYIRLFKHQLQSHYSMWGIASTSKRILYENI